MRTATVLVIACPHTLGLALPLVVALSTAVAAKAGILVKDRLALERMRTIDAVLFDKTGTLTKGAHVLTSVTAFNGLPEQDTLDVAAGIESISEHPLARAIVTAAKAPRAAYDFQVLAGRGVRAARRSPRSWESTRSSPKCCPATRIRPWPSSKRGATRWRWSATASTTHPRWLAPTSVLRSARARMWPSSRPAWCWPPPTRAGVAAVVRLSRASYRKMIQNLGWAAGYNLITLPLAAGALAWAGIALSPAAGALLMSASTIVVALNAQTLRRLTLTPER